MRVLKLLLRTLVPVGPYVLGVGEVVLVCSDVLEFFNDVAAPAPRGVSLCAVPYLRDRTQPSDTTPGLWFRVP